MKSMSGDSTVSDVTSGADAVTDAMLRAQLRALLVLAWAACACSGAGTRYAFYRNLRGEMGRRKADQPRRVFGGAATSLSAFPAACVLLDRYWSPRCSASVLAPRWALTAAHCVTPQIAYVMFNSRHPNAHDGDVSAVSYLYRHPSYRVLQQDEGRGIDVTQLHHDVGLLRTRTDMKLDSAPSTPPLISMALYNLEKLKDEEVQVLGYGRTDSGTQGEQLFEVRLRLVPCARDTWEYCMCGQNPARAGASGVCSGDSGGPVLYHGSQVGVTSMGPLECAEGLIDPSEGATSVFTALYNYVDLVNATMHNADAALKMRRINEGAAPVRAAPRVLAALGIGAALLPRPAR